MSKQKRKRDLMSTLNHVERYHRRRMVLTIHAVFLMAIQFAIWTNWYASYAARGSGFEGNFFADRFIISGVLLIFLIGHFVLTRLTEARDRAVVQALQTHDVEASALEQEDVGPYRLLDDDFEDEDDLDDAIHFEQEQRQHIVRNQESGPYDQRN